MFAVGAALALTGGPAHAQMSSSAPIVVKQEPAKDRWLKAEVIHADGVAIMVRDQKNSMDVTTFTYAPEIRDKMQQLLDRGGYQYGDKVKIRYQTGQTVALEVRGKPSKPI